MNKLQRILVGSLTFSLLFATLGCARPRNPQLKRARIIDDLWLGMTLAQAEETLGRKLQPSTERFANDSVIGYETNRRLCDRQWRMILVFGRNRILKHVFIRPEGELPFNDHEQLFACAKANLAAVYGEPSMVSASSMAKDMQTLQFRKGDVEVVIQYMPFISSINIIYEAPSEKGL